MIYSYPGDLPVGPTPGVQWEVVHVMPVDIKVAGCGQIQHVAPAVAPHPQNYVSVLGPVKYCLPLERLHGPYGSKFNIIFKKCQKLQINMMYFILQ